MLHTRKRCQVGTDSFSTDSCGFHVFLNKFDIECLIYSALQIDVTYSSGVEVAAGSDVTVLFPGESKVLGCQGRTGEVQGQRNKFSCQYCSLPMNVGDVAIFCERAGPDKVIIFICPCKLY